MNLPEEIVREIIQIRSDMINFQRWRNKMYHSIRKIKYSFSNRFYNDDMSSTWAFQGQGYHEPQIQGENCTICGEYKTSYTAKKFCYIH